MPYGCGNCSYAAFTSADIQKHSEEKHIGIPYVLNNTGPTIAKELKHADSIHIKEVKEVKKDAKPAVLTSSVGPPKATELATGIQITEINIPEIHIPDIDQPEMAVDPLQNDLLQNLDEVIRNESNSQDNFEVSFFVVYYKYL